MRLERESIRRAELQEKEKESEKEEGKESEKEKEKDSEGKKKKENKGEESLEEGGKGEENQVGSFEGKSGVNNGCFATNTITYSLCSDLFLLQVKGEPIQERWTNAPMRSFLKFLRVVFKPGVPKWLTKFFFCLGLKYFVVLVFDSGIRGWLNLSMNGFLGDLGGVFKKFKGATFHNASHGKFHGKSICLMTNLNPLHVGTDLRTNPFKEGGDDVNPIVITWTQGA